ncbi:MAG: hypothetical protein IT338_08500 [Thermomicrobiales bacterium]|nr:hypothetical protein [Thermomicrobiales bacterium]
MHIDFDQAVFGSDTQKLGDVDGLVVDAGTKRATFILVGSGLLGNTKHKIGVSAISAVAQDGLHLGHLAPKGDDRAPILDSVEVELPERDQPLPTFIPAAGAGGPIITTEPDLPGRYPADNSFFEVAPIDPGPVEVFSNLQENEVVLGKGTEVFASDGDKLGHAVAFDLGDMGLVERVVVSEGLIFKKRATIALPEIEEFGTDAIHLRLTKAAAASRM